ncbi:catalase [Archangium gephyra]|uniref:Catalase n=1 Tax=Archangium gephyra TaxID=48 RepID=A0AAC8QA98_9BACT|nr:Catalase [Archangium gephyra]REG24008.1 catalase [Archangium gephyra]
MDKKTPETVSINERSKDLELERNRSDPAGQRMTTGQGVPVEDTDNSLKVGARGPTLLEDFHLREKIMRFDHERIPERVVHARGSAAHGYFQVYESLAEYTKAKVFQDPSKKTPVFVRFSTVAGSRGSADTVRDVRGFAVKFYTEEGNWDLVGNNIPVFFIQDGIKFPDIVHAAKPEPHHEMPQASTAHDSFWDFISLMPESAHMIMWVMSDRAIPRSYRMMEGFGVHTFRLVNAKGVSRFVKFHWKPLLGVHSLVWDEAQKLAGKDPDFHRRDLWEAIEKGNFPEYELGLQIIDEKDADKLGIDLLDSTKIIPEEVVPVRRVGKLVLNRNPTNFFAETEQVAFCTSHVVPGIDFTDDPLLQARNFSYLDTQLTRLGGPNFTEIPINRPIAPVHNFHQDGFHRQTIDQGRANYFPNSLGGGCPFMAAAEKGGYRHFPEKVAGEKVRQRAESFQDHFSQAGLFFRSMSKPEREHIIMALQFELAKVEREEVRKRVVEQILAKIDAELVTEVAQGLGMTVPTMTAVKGKLEKVVDTLGLPMVDKSPALSQENQKKDSIKTRRIGVLVADGFDTAELQSTKAAIEQAGGELVIISRRLGMVKGADGQSVKVDKSALTTGSFEYDAVFVPGGAASVSVLKKDGDSVHFIQEAYRHCKPIGVTKEATGLLEEADVSTSSLGVVVGEAGGQDFPAKFIAAIAQHRFWARHDKDLISG